MGIVRANQFDTIFLGEFYQHLIGFLLQGERLAIGTNRRVGHFMALQFQIIVVAENAMIPFDGFTRAGYITLQNLMRHLARNTCRTNHQPLVVFLQVFAVGTRTHIIAIYPRVAHQLNQILITLIVLGKHYQVITAHVFFATPQFLGTIARHIHLATEDGLERLQPLFLPTFVDAAHVVMKFLDSEHIAVIGNGHAFHAVGYRFIYQLLNTRLAIQY